MRPPPPPSTPSCGCPRPHRPRRPPTSARASPSTRTCRTSPPPSRPTASRAAGLGFQLVDSRSTPSWDQAHVPGAIHLPTALIPEQAERLLDKGLPVVTYCWGPGCNGGARSALALAELGFQVKEMLGGIEYWIREGFEVETWQGSERRAGADPLTAPTDSGDCGC